MILAAALLLALQTPPSSVSIPTWSVLKSYYDYKHLAPTDISEESTPAGSGKKITFSFPGTGGDVIKGDLVMPKSDSRVPCVILIHGLSGNKASPAAMFGAQLLARGVAYAAIDLPGHGTRSTEEDLKAIKQITGAFLANTQHDLLATALQLDPSGSVQTFLGKATVGGVLDNRHLLDYITSRSDIDYHHIVVMGYSLGSIVGTILGAVDNRVTAMDLCVGGDPVLPLLSTVKSAMLRNATAGACSLYAAHYENRPVLMENGTHDTIMPRSATDRLYSAFPEKEDKKHISWYDSDHFLPSLAIKEAVEWTAGHCGKSGTG